MSDRRTALRPAALGGQLDRESQLARSQALNARDVQVTFAAASTAYVRHGLGRRYVGGWCVGQTTSGTTVAVNLGSAALCQAAGYDPAVYAQVKASANNSETFKLKVF